MTDMIRWGIIGTGNIAGQFTRDLTAAKHAELAAVASRTFEKANQFANEHNIPKAYGSYEELAAAADIDAVYIGTPHVYHKENTLMCLKHGKHVLCEKPLAINEQEVLEMIEAARGNGCFLMEAMWMYFFPAIQKAAEIVRRGDIGEIRMLRADFAFKADLERGGRLVEPNLGGGALLDIGIYPLALAQIVFGQPPKTIATTAHFSETGVDLQSGIVMKYPNGACAVLSCSFETAMPQEAVIAGTKGVIRIPHEFSHPEALILRRNGEEEYRSRRADLAFERRGIGYYLEAEEAGRCIREGRTESRIMPHSESLAIVRTMDRIRRIWDMTYPGEPSWQARGKPSAHPATRE